LTTPLADKKEKEGLDSLNDTRRLVVNGQSSTVEKIVDLWNQDLEEHAKSFFEQATQIQEWDEKLIMNRTKMNKLHLDFLGVEAKQRELEDVLDKISTSQQEVLNCLQYIERQVPEQPTRQDHMRERKDTSEMAERLNTELNTMSTSVANIVKHLNSASVSDFTSPLSNIVQVLNSHFDTLEWADNESTVLEAQLREAEARLPRNVL
jgi:chromosome segregation ATPase